jgi:hypothetical protein
VRCRSVSPPSGARRSWVLSGPAVVVRVSVRSSLMAPNVVAERPRIKHVFEVCREFSLAGRPWPNFVGAASYGLATVRSHVLLIEHLID